MSRPSPPTTRLRCTEVGDLRYHRVEIPDTALFAAGSDMFIPGPLVAALAHVFGFLF